jgi:hypothetical protein
LAVARWTLLVLLSLPPLALLTESTNVVSAGADLIPVEPGEVCYCDASGAAAGGRMPTLATIYATCSGLVLAWQAVGALASARIGMRSTEAPASLRTLLQRVVADRSTYPRLRVGAVAQPVALGLFRPMIVLPEWFALAEPEARVEAALAHEWAHLRRGDLWTLAASRLSFVFLFLHPLFYVLRNRLRADQEAIADAEAAGFRGKIAYAEALVGWARRTSSPSFGSALGLFGRPSLLRKRVALLLDSGFRVEPACPRGWIVAVRAAAAALVIGLGALAPTGVARTAVSALLPVTSPVVPHTHARAMMTLLCPPGPAAPSWPELCCPKDVRREADAK